MPLRIKDEGIFGKKMEDELSLKNIELEISNPCNENCVHCFRVCKRTKHGFLSANQVQIVLEQAKALGANKALITGGESLLNPEWKRIVQIADELGFHFSFYTNGSLMKNEDADFLASVKHLKEVQISLYSLDETVHDSITGVPGSCVKTKNAIHLLRARNIPLLISSPVMQENKASVYDVMLWCQDEAIRNCTDIFLLGDSDYTKKNLSHRLSLNDIRLFFMKTIKEFNGRLSYILGKGYGKRDLTQICFYNGAAHSLCVAGDGTIYPAIGWYEPLGNIATDKLSEVFQNHPLLQELRNIYVSDIDECMKCTCSDFCQFCFNTHIIANYGKLGKVDREWCDFIKLLKNIATEKTNSRN